MLYLAQMSAGYNIEQGWAGVGPPAPLQACERRSYPLRHLATLPT